MLDRCLLAERNLEDIKPYFEGSHALLCTSTGALPILCVTADRIAKLITDKWVFWVDLNDVYVKSCRLLHHRKMENVKVPQTFREIREAEEAARTA